MIPGSRLGRRGSDDDLIEDRTDGCAGTSRGAFQRSRPTGLKISRVLFSTSCASPASLETQDFIQALGKDSGG